MYFQAYTLHYKYLAYIYSGHGFKFRLEKQPTGLCCIQAERDLVIGWLYLIETIQSHLRNTVGSQINLEPQHAEVINTSKKRTLTTRKY